VFDELGMKDHYSAPGLQRRQVNSSWLERVISLSNSWSIMDTYPLVVVFGFGFVVGGE
jgi:hypothetical protein